MLKPCPFCGREPELVEADIGDPGDSFTKWNVFCPTGAPQCWITPQTGFMLSERAAIAAWNTRAPDPRLIEAVKEIENKLVEVYSRVDLSGVAQSLVILRKHIPELEDK